MARRPREDFPNSWHHVVNRGIAKRALFEDRSEVRFFLAQLAKQYRKGRIEVHAFCLMTTHFHLLVRSPQGELSEAMHSIQSAYSRHFNRRHRRDGALTRGRYFSKPVSTKEYRRTVVQYIDHNPVSAGLVTVPLSTSLEAPSTISKLADHAGSRAPGLKQKPVLIRVDLGIALKNTGTHSDRNRPLPPMS